MHILIILILTFLTYSAHSIELARSNLDEQYFIKIQCDNLNDKVVLNLHNNSDHYIKLKSLVENHSSWNEGAVRLIRRDTLEKHYTDWVFAKENHTFNFSKSENDEIILPPYSTVKMDLFVSQFFSVDEGVDYIMYITFTASLIDVSRHIKVFTSNNLLIKDGICY